MDTKRIDLPYGWSAEIKTRGWLSERESRAVARALVSSIAVGAKLTKGGFNDDDPTTYDAFTALTETEQDDLAAFQGVLVCQFVQSLNTGVEIVKGPLDVSTVENFPQPVFTALASACLLEWQDDGESVLDPKAGSDA